jgi:CRISPR-associated protein Cmr5
MPENVQQHQPSAPHAPLALQRAQHALERVEKLERDVEGKNRDERKEILGNYVAYVEGLPANIIRSGLGQAIAMEKASAKNDPGHKLLYEHIDSWLTADRKSAPYRNQIGRLLNAIVNNDQHTYVRAQAEALAYLEWLKKFAVAFLKEDEGPVQNTATAEKEERE